MLHVPFLDRKETVEDLRVTERLGHSCFCLAIKIRFKSCEAIYFFQLLLHFIMVGYMYRQKEYCKVCKKKKNVIWHQAPHTFQLRRTNIYIITLIAISV